MAYIGNSPEKGNFRKADSISVVNGQATYNLLVGGVAVNPNQNQCIVSLNGVVQSSGDSFTCASSQITFVSNLQTGDVIDFILILGDTLNVGTVSDDTIGLAQLSATGSPSSSNFLRGDNSWATAGGANTPAFEAFLSATTSNITNDTDTLITFDTEVFDSDSKYDTSNGRFTPAVAGKYLLYGSVQILGTSTADSNENIVKLYKNGSQHMVTYWITSIPQGVISWTTTVDFNTTDYMQVYAKINNSSGDRKIVGAAANQKYTWFGGHKLIT